MHALRRQASRKANDTISAGNRLARLQAQGAAGAQAESHLYMHRTVFKGNDCTGDVGADSGWNCASQYGSAREKELYGRSRGVCRANAGPQPMGRWSQNGKEDIYQGEEDSMAVSRKEGEIPIQPFSYSDYNAPINGNKLEVTQSACGRYSDSKNAGNYLSPGRIDRAPNGWVSSDNDVVSRMIRAGSGLVGGLKGMIASVQLDDLQRGLDAARK